MPTYTLTPAQLRGAGIYNSFEIPAGGGSSFTNTYSFRLDGTNTNLTSTSMPSSVFGGDFTVSCWVRQPGFGGVRIIWDTGSSTSLRLDGGRISYLTPSRILLTPTTGEYDDDTWHNIVIVFKNTTNKKEIWADGQLVLFTDNIVSYPVTLTGFNFTIGNTFFGYIDELAIWSSALTSTQIPTIYNDGVAGDLTPLNPVTWYRMGDEATWDGLQWSVPDQGSGGYDAVSNNAAENDREENVPS